MPFDIEGAKKAGYSDAEIANFLGEEQGFDTAAAKKAGYSDTEIVSHLSQGAQTPAPEAAPPEPSMMDKVAGAGKEMLRGAGMAARTVAHGMAGAITIPAELMDAVTTLVDEAGILPERLPKFRATSRLDNALTATGLPQPQNDLERIISAAGSGASSARTLAAGAALTRPTTQVGQGVKEMLTSQPGLQMASGASGAAASQVGAEAGFSPVGQAGLGIVGGTLPVLGVSMATRPMSSEHKELTDLAKKHDVPLAYQDVVGGSKKLDSALEQVPLVGTAGYRAAGAKKIDVATRRMVNAHEQAMEEIPFDSIDQVREVATSNGPYAKTAQNVLSMIDNAGSDWTKIMQASGNLQALKVRHTSNKLYEKVEELSRQAAQQPTDKTFSAAASQYGRTPAKPSAGTVDLAKTLEAVESQLARESKAVVPDKTLINTLTTIRDRLGSGTFMDFSSSRAFRSELGSIIDNYMPGNQVIGDKGSAPLLAVKSALEKDMGDWAKNQGGEIYQAWKTADAFYRNRVIPYKDPLVAKALKTDLPDEVYKQFIQTGRAGGGEDRAIKFYNALDERGRAAVRYGMVANALDEAFIPNATKGAEISPAKFAQSLERIQEARGVFFKGDQKKEIDGFVNLMRHAERFGQYAADPMNGRQVVPWIVGITAAGGAVASPATAAAVAGGAASAAGLSKILTTETGRNLLLRAANAKPGSKQMIAIQTSLGAYLNAQANQRQENPGEPFIPVPTPSPEYFESVQPQ